MPPSWENNCIIAICWADKQGCGTLVPQPALLFIRFWVCKMRIIRSYGNGGVLFCSPKENQKRQLCRCKCSYRKKIRYGVFFLVAQERTKEGNFVAVKVTECNERLYRRPAFLGGRRHALACGAQSAPWKTKNGSRRKLAFSIAHFFVFFYPGTCLAT